MDYVLGHILVVFGLVVKTVHLNISLRVQHFKSWSNHEKLLVYLNFLNSLIVTEELLLHLESVSAADGVLKFLSHGNCLWVVHINKVLFDRHKVFDKLFFRVPFDFLNLLYFDLKQVLFLVFAHFVLKDKEVQDNLQHMRLKERHEHENTFVVQHPDNLVEVGLAFIDSLRLVINRDGIKCTLVNCELEEVSIRVQIRKVSDIANFEGERQVLRLGLLHLLHDLIFVIDALDDEIGHL